MTHENTKKKFYSPVLVLKQENRFFKGVKSVCENFFPNSDLGVTQENKFLQKIGQENQR